MRSRINQCWHGKMEATPMGSGHAENNNEIPDQSMLSKGILQHRTLPATI